MIINLLQKLSFNFFIYLFTKIYTQALGSNRKELIVKKKLKTKSPISI